jgi:hypothetical protein
VHDGADYLPFRIANPAAQVHAILRGEKSQLQNAKTTAKSQQRNRNSWRAPKRASRRRGTIRNSPPRGPMHSPTSISTLMTVDDQTLKEELLVAYEILRDPEKASHVVAQAVAQLPYTAAKHIESRLRAKSAQRPRDSYKSFIGQRELLRRLLFEKLERVELAEEKAGRLLDPLAQIRAQLKHLVLSSLRSNSFYGAIGGMEILHNYTARETLRVFNHVTHSRGAHKDEAACSHAKGAFLKALVQRFGTRVQLRREGPSLVLNWRPVTRQEAELVRRILPVFLPPLSAPPCATRTNPFLERVQPVLEESSAEMEHLYTFLHPERFEALLGSILPSRAPYRFEHRLRILTADPKRTDPDSGGMSDAESAPRFDLGRVKDLVGEYRDRRWMLDTSTLSVRVDGIDRAQIDKEGPRHHLHLEERASLVELVGRDSDGQPVEVANYLLTYDSPKREHWNIDVPRLGEVHMVLDYDENERVSARISIRSDRSISHDLSASEQRRTDRDLTNNLREQLPPNGSANDSGHESFLFQECLTRRTIPFRPVLLQFVARAVCALRDKSLTVLDFALSLRHKWTGDHESLSAGHSALECTSSENDRLVRSHEALAGELDGLVARQASLVHQVLAKAAVFNIEMNDVPSVYLPHERRSTFFGILSISILGAELLGARFAKELASSLGWPIATVGLILLAGAALASSRLWWKYGWSSRLYRAYHKVGNAIERLLKKLDNLNLHSVEEQGYQSTQIHNIEPGTQHRVVDWRGLTLATTLRNLLQSPIGISRDVGTSWIVNSFSERELMGLLDELGEKRSARRVARVILNQRPIASRSHLVRVLGEALELPKSVVRVLADDDVHTNASYDDN